MCKIGYMLTGETVPGPIEVRPARPFDPRDCACGPGAWQFVVRYSELTLGEEVFTARTWPIRTCGHDGCR